MERYDIAIIGTGPAGLEAALTARARNKSILLVGSKALSDRVSKAHEILNYLGLPKISGEAMAEVFKKQIAEANIEITEGKVMYAYPMSDYFALQVDFTDEILEATTVILATGLAKTKGLPGEDKLLGSGVSYCATCDAQFYRGRRTIVLGYTPKEEAEADFLSEIAAEVLYFPQYKDEVHTNEKVRVIKEIPVEIIGGMKAEALKTEAATYETDGIFILRESIAPDKMVPGLALKDGHVDVDLNMATNIPGCFAAGDITGTPYQYIKAAGQGNVAALSAVDYISHH